MNVRRILFPTDFGESSTRALAHALFQAEAYNAELHILHVVHWEEENPVKRLPNADTIMEEMQKVAQVALAEMLKQHKESPFDIKEKCLMGPTATEVIMDYILTNNIDLVVMGTHGRKGISHFLLGSVAEEIVRKAPCPVVTVRADADHTDLAPIRKILAPIDFSLQSKHALHRARHLAALHGSELHLMFVVFEFEHGFGNVDAGFTMMNEMMPKIVEEQQKHLLNFYNKVGGPDVELHRHVLVGKPDWRIIDFAKREEIDYIVMATHGYSGFNHLIMGSTTERVLRMAPCPVYAMKVRG